MIAPESAHLAFGKNNLAIGTSAQGKPLSKALGEVDIGGAYVEFYTEETRRIYGEPIPSPRPDARLLAIKPPIGVQKAPIVFSFVKPPSQGSFLLRQD